MRPTTQADEDLETRRRRVLYRASHRGTREMDFILGRFASAELGAMTAGDLDVFEDLLEAPDTDLYQWVSGQAPTPPDYQNEMFRRILAFHAAPRTE